MLTVVIPAFNEEAAIEQTLLQVKRSLEGFAHEVIVVDDGSTDGTGDRASEAGARVVRRPRNLGYGAALKTGIGSAQHDTIIITDADGTYPNDQIPRLLGEFEKGFNMVVRSRTGSHYRESLTKAPLRILLKWLLEFTTGRKIPDINSGFRVFSRKEITPFFKHLCNTFSFTTSLTLAYLMTSKFVAYLPISYNKRIGRTKVRLFRDSLRTLQYMIQAIPYYNPLKIFLLLCAMILAWSFLCLVIASLAHIYTAFYLGVGGVPVAILVFCLGLLAELLRQIMDKE